MSDSPFQVTGIASGISWDEIISKTLEAARKPEEQWLKKIDTLEYKKSLYQELSSAFFKLRNTLTTLRLTTTFKSKTPEFTVRNAGQVINGEVKASNASDIIKATASANAEIAQWKIDVTQIATAQQVYSNKFTPTQILNLSGVFEIRVGAQVAKIDVQSNDTIATINQKIASAKDQSGNEILVTAQLIDGRLVLESFQTGLDNTGQKSGEMLVSSTSSNETKLPKAVADYPPNILSIKNSTTNSDYTQWDGSTGDFEYDDTNGVITWHNNAPPDGTPLVIEYSRRIGLTANSTTITALPTGAAYDSTSIKFDLSDTSTGQKYEEGADALTGDYHIDWASPAAPAIVWHASVGTSPTNTTVIVRQGSYTALGDPDSFVETNYSNNRNEFTLEDVSGSGVLEALGLTDSSGNLLNLTKAQDAELTINGIKVTRTENVIDDLIAEVKLELVGVGDVTMNITQDAQKAVDAVQAYVDAYNEVMTWINEKLDEKYTSATIEEDDDYLQNLLSASKGSTVFGALHGDQLLWNIKNQMRNLTVNPIDSAARGLATKKYMYTANSLGLNASFYLYTAGQAIRVNISPTDSLEDIRHNIANSTSITSTNGTSATDADLKLKVYLRDGQLVVDYNSASVLTSPRTDVIARNHASLDGGGYNYDILPYTVTTAPPVSGKLSVTLGSTEYKEGIDYKIETAEVSGRLESRLVWLATGSRPTDGQSYTTSYEYNTTAIAYSVISGADDLSTLGFHTDQSKSQLSTFGITTTADDYGKSGLVDFDPDVLFAAIQDDANNASNVMTSFFRSVDTYIGNLVDSSQVLVAGTAVTKGRIAGAMLSIDVEVETLNSQITKLERQLAERQTSMYKQYSDMELAIQKLNAQMSSMSQYFANTSGS